MLSDLEQMVILDILRYKELKIKYEYALQTFIPRKEDFYKILTALEKKGCIYKIKRGRRTFYALSDTGMVIAIIDTKMFDTPKKWRGLVKKSIYGFW